MTHRRHRLLLAALLLPALVTGCGSDAGGGTAPLSLSGLTETADEVPDAGADTCPLPYDIAAAAKTAGLDGAAGPGPVRDEGEPVATAEGGKRAEAGNRWRRTPGSW
ncbi:hypothetical protein ACFQ60_21350 [Streptomyces zhihengii]